MKRNKDLLTVLKSNNMRITAARRLLLQFILDNKNRHLPLSQIQTFASKNISGIDRSSIYRNLEAFKKLDIIQELNLPKIGKCFQYVLDRKVHHFYICKACGKANRGNQELFNKVDLALKDIHGFSKANLSVVFYGRCAKCSQGSQSP